MGKTARRSINDDESPSSPSNSPYFLNKHQEAAGQSKSHTLWSYYNNFSHIAALSQIKNVENKTLSTAAPLLSGSTSSSTSAYKTSQTTSQQTENVSGTQKPPTTTYTSHTTTYGVRTTTAARAFLNTNRSDELTKEQRLKMREEFYATYDVMTGIRIAATLGSFFLLMVFLIVYKSRSHSIKALKDPNIAARAAAAVQEEEDREMQEVFEKTAFSLYQDELELPPMPINFGLNRDRIASVGNVSCPPYLINPNLRFSSIGGGYSTLLEPPRRYSDMSGRNRRQSSTESSRILSAYHLNDNYSNQNENFFNESDCEEADDEFDQRYTTTTAEIASYPHGLLSVPRGSDSRRSSGMTCCSTESSFLERRCSAITLGLSSLPPLSRASSRRASREAWDFDYQTSAYPGIHIIEATPKSSPCPSERQSHMSGGCNIKDHIKVLDRFKRRRHEDNSIDSISEYPDEISNNNNNNNNVNHNDHHQQQQQQQQYHSSDSRILSDNVVNSNSNTHQSKTLMSSNINNINNNNNNHKLEDFDDDDMSHHPKVISTVDNEPRRAPLASLSSFKMSSIECQDSTDGQNCSVFDESCNDTDDDLEQFSTDSDEISLQSPPSTDQHVPSGSSTIKCDNSATLRNDITVAKATKAPSSSSPMPPLKVSAISSSCEIIERQQRSNDNNNMTIRPTSYSSNNINNNNCINKKSNSSECVAINVIDYNNESSSMKPSAPRSSSAVILEMPILVKQQGDDNIEIIPQESQQQQHVQIEHCDDDPLLIPGTSSRKWSKETLF